VLRVRLGRFAVTGGAVVPQPPRSEPVTRRPPSTLTGPCLWALRGLVVLLLAGPLSYYAGLRAPDDERFAWRMFSAVRVRECRVLVRHGHDTRPMQGLHGSWVHAMERGREAVITRYLASQCTAGGAPILERHCRSARGEALASLAYHYDCAQWSMRVEGLDDGS
jgi:hypothetical protein